MLRIDGYLSRLAQNIEPSALVYVLESEGIQKWFLKVEDTDKEFGLGDNFHRAQQGVRAWINSMKSKQAKKEAENEQD